MSAEAADFYERLFVNDFYGTSVDHYDAFVAEVGQRAYGVGGGHVRQVGEILASHIYPDGGAVLFISVAVFESYERFGKAASQMLLSEVDYVGVGASEIVRQFADEKPCNTDVLVDELLYYGHGYRSQYRRLDCGGG